MILKDLSALLPRNGDVRIQLCTLLAKRIVFPGIEEDPAGLAILLKKLVDEILTSYPADTEASTQLGMLYERYQGKYFRKARGLFRKMTEFLKRISICFGPASRLILVFQAGMSLS